MSIKHLILSVFLTALSQAAFAQNNPKNMTETSSKNLSYLALGDSYTIGEAVAEEGRYPNQTVDLLKANHIVFDKPSIVAKTGWTTDELAKGIEVANIGGKTYDLVTLLIGVNNQYRGRDLDTYKGEFKALLEQAIQFAKGNPQRVVVLSIPDWGITPFGQSSGRDLKKVSEEIDAFNKAKQDISSQLGVHYIDITEDYRAIGGEEIMLAHDKLHPSEKVYERWAKRLCEVIVNRMDF